MLKLRIENLGETAILHVCGYIVIGPETEVLRTAVLSQTGASAVVLDLTRVSRIDARGLGLLLELREQLESRGIEFRLMNVSSLVEQILRMTCLDSVFEIAREEEIRSRDSVHQQMNKTFKSLLFRAFVLYLVFSTGNNLGLGQRYQDFTASTPLKENEVLIIGFMGGRESWNNDKRGVRKLALRLRGMNLPGVHVETVENKKRKLAIELIHNAFDRDRNGLLDKHERTSARLIIYGQSFGGAAVVKLARQLKEIGLPVLLTIQVDSVGRGDKKIPSNVSRAANLFQRNGLFIKGEREIRPEDPSKTTIIGNFRFDYNRKKIDLSEVSWVKRLFQTAHTKMDHDPEVWSLVEKLIVDVVSPLP